MHWKTKKKKIVWLTFFIVCSVEVDWNWTHDISEVCLCSWVSIKQTRIKTLLPECNKVESVGSSFHRSERLVPGEVYKKCWGWGTTLDQLNQHFWGWSSSTDRLKNFLRWFSCELLCEALMWSFATPSVVQRPEHKQHLELSRCVEYLDLLN